MEEIFLEVEVRKEKGKNKVKDLRQKGFIPAIIYGAKKEPLMIKVPQREFLRLVHTYHLESVVINLKIDADKKKKTLPSLIKEIQYDPVKGDIIHIDFNEISLRKSIKINVPITTKGEPQGVKQEGGSLEHILWEVEVECLPTDIPKEIIVDVSALKIGDAIHIKDIIFPPKVKVLNDPEAIVLSVSAPLKEELVTKPTEVEEKLEPEVIKEKKEVPKEEGTEEKEEK